MRIYCKNRAYVLQCITLFVMTAFIACKKTDTGNPSIPAHFPDYVTKVTSSVSGFVSNENNMPVVGAEVRCENTVTITDRYGYFEVKNVQVVKDAATVTISFPGYFKGIKTFMAIEGKAAFFRIKLLPKVIAGTFSASSGGTVSMADGLTASFPANAVKNELSGAAYSGTVTVSAKWIDPTSTELHKIMPGDLRGISADGALKGLVTYGMVAVELTGSSGEALQIADGKKATLTFPLPPSLTATAPATIPLWYFDEAKGLWKEEGSAVKTGNTYTGEVSHFTFWNCDISVNYINFTCTVTNMAGQPVANTCVSIKRILDGSIRRAYTDASGIASGWVPGNENIIMEVTIEGCETPFLQNPILTGSSSITVDATLPADTKVALVRGTVKDCDNNPVQNGFVLITKGDLRFRATIISGAYSFSTILCGDSTTITLLAENLSKQSAAVNKVITAGENLIEPIQACAISTEQYCDFTINDDAYMMNPVSPSLVNLSEITPDSARNSAYFRVLLVQNGIPVATQYGEVQVYWYSYGSVPQVNGPHFLYSINPYLPINNPQVSISILPRNYSFNFKTFPIHISEYGTVGQFVSGSFSGILYETNGAESILERPYNVSCNFRVRRYQ